MAQRVTRKQLQVALEYMCKQSHGLYHVATSYNDIGGLHIERVYGQPYTYRVMKYSEHRYYNHETKTTEVGIGETYAWRSSTMSAQAMLDMLWNMSDALNDMYEKYATNK